MYKRQESANAESMEVDDSGNANDDENLVSDEEDGENAGSQFPEADQRINMVMGPINKVHSPDTSKLIMKRDSSGNEELRATTLGKGPQHGEVRILWT